MNTRQLKRLRDVKAEAEAWMGSFPEEILGGRCFYFAAAVAALLGAPVVAGSALWQFRPDDGVTNTHFGYEFETEIGAGTQFKIGPTALPEMHVWNVWLGKVLDLSTSDLPDQLRKGLGVEWDAGMIPPPIYFGPAAGKRDRFRYNADRKATALARAFLETLYRRRNR